MEKNANFAPMKHFFLFILASVLLNSCVSVVSPTQWRHALLVPDTVPGPYHRVLAASTVHAALLEELGAGRRVVGVCDAAYVMDSAMRNALESGLLADFGSSDAPDCERIVASGVDAVMLSYVDNSGHGAWASLPVPLVESIDYLESTPLGRAEWMRFYGRMVERGESADSLFAEVERRYGELCRQASSHGLTRVLTDIPQSGAWYVPGGESYLAHLYRDAGFTLPCSCGTETGSVALSVEQVLAVAADADLWLVKYAAPRDLTYDDLLRLCSVAPRIKAFREHRVFGCNTLRCPYYEQVPFHPDRLLRDLLCHTNIYFRPLQINN